MIDSEIAFVIANILKVNEPLVGIPKDLGLNSPIASHNTLGNLRKLFPLVPRGYFETSEDTRLSNPYMNLLVSSKVLGLRQSLS